MQETQQLPLEIERKYLLSALPPQAQKAPCLQIEQGWIPGTKIHERLRRVVGANGQQLYRTIKLGRGVQRIEVEEEPPLDLFIKLWPLTEGRRVTKRRFCISEGDFTWELDAFTDRDLVLAEVELPAADFVVTLPGWLAPFVVREVTDEDQYVNLNLAR